jgi:hypothetical protein
MVDRWKRIAPLAAVPVVGLVITALSLPQTPDSTASGAKVLAFAQHHRTSITATALLIAYAGALSVLYFSSLSGYLRSRGANQLATTTMVGGGLFAAGMLVGAGTAAALTDAPHHMSADAAQAVNIVQNDAFAPMMFAGLGIAVLSSGVAMLRTKSMPKALGIVTVVVGVADLSGIVSWFGFMASGLLLLVTAGYLYQRIGQPLEITIPEVPAPRAETEQAAPRARRATTTGRGA